MKEAFGWLGATMIAVLLLAAIVLGGWQLGWWFTYQNAHRQGRLINIESHNIRSSYGNQQTLRDQITQQVSNVLAITVQIAATPSLASELKAQRAAVLGILCNDATQVVGDPLPADQASFVQTNCLDGTVNPASAYAIH
jgi:hypothetical protein